MRYPIRFPALLAGAGLSAAACSTGGVTRVTVNPAIRYQTMTGWEATSQAGQAQPLYPLYRDTLIALAAHELGISRLRLEVRSGVEHRRDYWRESRAGRLTGNAFRCGRYETVNDNDDPRVLDTTGFQFTELDESVEQLLLPLKAQVESRGGHLALSVNYVSFITQCPQSARYDHRNPEEYAEFALAVVRRLRAKYGLTPEYWEVILEPENTRDWTGELIGRAIVATARRFREEGLAIRFIAPSTTGMSAAVDYYRDLAAVPGARRELAELSYHRYRGVSLEALRAIGAIAARDSVGTAMLEHIGSGIDDLIEDLTIAGNTAWQQYALSFPDMNDRGGLYYGVDTSDASRPVVVEGSRTRYLRQVFRYVPLGSRRIEATAGGGSARALAFQKPDSGLVVVVRSQGPSAITVDGLRAGRYGITYATERERSGALPDTTIAAGVALTVQLPAAGVLTVFTR